MLFRSTDQNADDFSKKLEFYTAREKMIFETPKHRAGFPFLSQEQFDELPLLIWIDINGRVILNHPELPDNVKQVIAKYAGDPKETPLPTGSDKKTPVVAPSCEDEEPKSIGIGKGTRFETRTELQCRGPGEIPRSSWPNHSSQIPDGFRRKGF